MIYAINEFGKKVKAAPKATAVCQSCQGTVVAKCGEINIWHWAHEAFVNCQYEPKSQWHIKWQEMFPEKNVEVYVKTKTGHRIADVMLDEGTVIEFQNSSISPDTIKQREKDHKEVVWVINATDKRGSLVYDVSRFGVFKIKWKWMPKSILYCKGRVFINLKENILYEPVENFFYKVIHADNPNNMIVKMSYGEIKKMFDWSEGGGKVKVGETIQYAFINKATKRVATTKKTKDKKPSVSNEQINKIRYVVVNNSPLRKKEVDVVVYFDQEGENKQVFAAHKYTSRQEIAQIATQKFCNWHHIDVLIQEYV